MWGVSQRRVGRQLEDGSCTELPEKFLVRTGLASASQELTEFKLSPGVDSSSAISK